MLEILLFKPTTSILLTRHILILIKLSPFLLLKFCTNKHTQPYAQRLTPVDVLCGWKTIPWRVISSILRKITCKCYYIDALYIETGIKVPANNVHRMD